MLTTETDPVISKRTAVLRKLHPTKAPRTVISTPTTKLPPSSKNGGQELRTLRPINLGSLIIPPEATSSIEHDVAYIPSLGCSGSLLHDKYGTNIGLITAEHCSLRGSGKNSRTRFKGNDGQTYVTVANGINVQTGADYGHLTTIGEVETIIAPAADDTGLDLVIGAFKGHSADEVMDSYNTNKLTDAELKQLKINDSVYLSGWPVSQPGSPNGFERQDFASAFIGHDVVTTAIGETLAISWTVLARDKDGAVCSFGDSGGEGFVLRNGKKRSIGVLSAFYDFTGKTYGTPESGEATRQYFQSKYGVNLSGADAICGFAYKVPTGKDYAELHVVNKNGDVPGFSEAHSEAAQLVSARKAFLDPTYRKNIIDGTVELIDPVTGTTSWKQRPAIFYDPETFSAVIASFNPDAFDSVELDYVESMAALNVYAQVGKDTGQILKSTGNITKSPTQAEFIDSQGLAFGDILANGLDAKRFDIYRLLFNKDSALYTVKDLAYSNGK